MVATNISNFPQNKIFLPHQCLLNWCTVFWVKIVSDKNYQSWKENTRIPVKIRGHSLTWILQNMQYKGAQKSDIRQIATVVQIGHKVEATRLTNTVSIIT